MPESTKPKLSSLMPSKPWAMLFMRSDPEQDTHEYQLYRPPFPIRIQISEVWSL